MPFLTKCDINKNLYYNINNMKILILNCKTGGGHTCVADSVKMYFENHGYSIDIEDALNFSSKAFSKFISFFHKMTYKHFPIIYSKSYISNDNIIYNHLLLYIIKYGAKKLYKYLSIHKYNFIICTHGFAGLMYSFAKDVYGSTVPYAMIETDYSLCPISEDFCPDIHFVSTKKCKEKLEKLKTGKRRIVISGIPIRQDFFKKNDITCCRKRYLNNINSIHIVLLGGSIGIGPIYKIIKNYYQNDYHNVELSVICGNNYLLYKKCKKLTKTGLYVYQYIENIAELMDSSDIIINKPGGVSITEASAKKILSGYFLVIEAYEKDNLNYFLSHNAAFFIKNLDNAILEMLNLYKNKEIKNRIINNAYNLINKNSVKIIYDEISKSL